MESSCSCAASFSIERAPGTAASGRWLVASATRTRGPAISISTSRPNASASTSVCPMNGTPAREICSFETGAVQIASAAPACAQAIAAIT